MLADQDQASARKHLIVSTEQTGFDESVVLAVPKGRILKELRPLLDRVGIVPSAAFDDENSRALRFATNVPGFEIIRVRSFDVPTFVAFGAAHLGVAGSDVLMEFDYPEVYSPLDLGIGHCRISVAELAEFSETDDPSRWSHVRVATKYPDLTRKHFAARNWRRRLGCATASSIWSPAARRLRPMVWSRLSILPTSHRV